jgi:hypothetical protein
VHQRTGGVNNERSGGGEGGGGGGDDGGGGGGDGGYSDGSARSQPLPVMAPWHGRLDQDCGQSVGAHSGRTGYDGRTGGE